MLEFVLSSIEKRLEKARTGVCRSLVSCGEYMRTHGSHKTGIDRWTILEKKINQCEGNHNLGNTQLLKCHEGIRSSSQLYMYW